MRYIYSIKKFITNHIFTIVFCGSILAFTLFLLSPVILTYFHQPPDTVNMMVGHYFEDYYEYLSYLKQGQQGHVLLQNLLSHDDSSVYFTPWWPYMVFGLISFIFHLKISPQLIYWFMSFSLISALLIATHVSIKLLLPDKKNILKMLALYLIMLSTSLFKVNHENGFNILPTHFWYANGNPFTRYNIGTLHHQTTHLIFLIGILCVIRYINHPQRYKLTFVLLLFSLLLLSLSPPQLFLFWGTYLSSALVYVILKPLKNVDSDSKWKHFSKIFIPFSISFIIILPFLMLLKKYSLTAPAYIATSSWDTNNLYFPPLDVLTMTTGPLFILALIGLPFYFKEVTYPKIIFFLISFLSFISISIPVSIFGKNIFSLMGFFNLRMITPNSYIFLGVSTMFLFIKILKKNYYIILASLTVILLYLPSMITIWKQNVIGIYSINYLQFMPKKVYQSVRLLESTNHESVILTSPSSSFGIVVPALTGHRVYIGRTFFTLDWDSKEKIARKFYALDMSKEEAKQFLSNNNINYIIILQNETDPLQMNKKYGLRSLSSDNLITILSPVY